MPKFIPDLLAAAALLAMVGNLSAAEKQNSLSKADDQALRAASASYAKAVNANDVAAVLSLWTDDADYVNDAGERFTGRATLEKLFKESLSSAKGRIFSFDTESMRLVAPGVVLEDGIGKYSGGDGDAQHVASRYSALWIKSGDKWLISGVRDLGDVPATGESASPLKQLAWLIGQWHSSDKEADVEMACDYMLENKFLKLQYDVKSMHGPEFTVVAMIGWDPSSNQIRSWFFDSRGGFGEGVWKRDANSWTISSSGVVADGRHGTMTNVWKYVDENTAVWKSKDRQLEGLPMPESEVKFVRKNASTASNNPSNKS